MLIEVYGKDSKKIVNVISKYFYNMEIDSYPLLNRAKYLKSELLDYFYNNEVIKLENDSFVNFLIDTIRIVAITRLLDKMVKKNSSILIIEDFTNYYNENYNNIVSKNFQKLVEKYKPDILVKINPDVDIITVKDNTITLPEDVDSSLAKKFIKELFNLMDSIVELQNEDSEEEQTDDNEVNNEVDNVSSSETDNYEDLEQEDDKLPVVNDVDNPVKK